MLLSYSCLACRVLQQNCADGVSGQHHPCTLKNLLELLPDGSLPNINIRTAILELLLTVRG